MKLNTILLCASLLGVTPLANSAGPSGMLGMNELAIHEAARLGNRGAVEKLLRSNPALRDAPTTLDSTPLHLAATNADAGPLQALLAAGANVNARDNEGNTPLHVAVFSVRQRNVQLLLEANADPLLKTNAGRDASSMARKARADEIAGIIALRLLKGCAATKPC